jgi:hypothetical protein
VTVDRAHANAAAINAAVDSLRRQLVAVVALGADIVNVDVSVQASAPFALIALRVCRCESGPLPDPDCPIHSAEPS